MSGKKDLSKDEKRIIDNLIETNITPEDMGGK